MFNVNLPTRIISGKGCLAENANLMNIGEKAIVVCGTSGAKKSGALDDVQNTLASLGIEYTVFDKITENPPLHTCFEGGKIAKNCDFVVGIGGGSALDAAKAIAAFATNSFSDPMDIFSGELNDSLPIIAIPTTAGTGSEANPYSVLSLPDGEKKRTFNSPASWPKVAFLDPSYTLSLPYDYTISTALDAFHHALESYLSPKSTDFSELLALYAAEKIWDVLTQYPESFSYEHREQLLYASCAAGAAISITGTGFPHPLGYSLTMLDGIPHGKACALFAGAYLDYNEKTQKGKERLSVIYDRLNVKPKVMREFIASLASVELSLTEEEIIRRVELIKDAKNYVNSPYVLSVDEMYDIYRSLFLKGRK